MVAEFEYPGLDIPAYIDRLDVLAETCQRAIRPQASPREAALMVNRILFEDLGFRGNTDDYYDPRNSFLNEVLDRQMGIPISMSVLLIEVARRVGVELSGLNFPGHFLVRFEDERDLLILDPFHNGLVLTVPELRDRLKSVLGPGAELGPEHLLPCSKHQIIARLLNNLAAIYRRANDVPRAIAVLERQAVVQPNNRRIEDELNDLRRRVLGLN